MDSISFQELLFEKREIGYFTVPDVLALDNAGFARVIFELERGLFKNKPWLVKGFIKLRQKGLQSD